MHSKVQHYDEITVKRGQFLRSYRKLIKDLEYIDNNSIKYYSLHTITDAIKRLIECDSISVEETRLGTLFTVKNYNKYQYKKQGEIEAGNSKGTPREHLGNDNKNVNNDKKEQLTTLLKQGEEYKIKTPLQYIVCSYKSLKGVKTDDRGWDTHNYKRSSKAAKSILEAFDSKHRDAAAWMKTKAEEFNTKGMTWTLETLARWAWDSKGDRNEDNYSQVDASTET